MYNISQFRLFSLPENVRTSGINLFEWTKLYCLKDILIDNDIIYLNVLILL